MSVVPLPVRISNEARGCKPRDVPGTASIPYGHRLRQQTPGNINFVHPNQIRLPASNKLTGAKQPQQHHQQEHRPRQDPQRITILPVDPKSESLRINAKDEREYNSILRTFHFEERTNKKILRKKIRHLVDEGMAAYEEDIAGRREKLRSMILAEEAAVTREIIDQAQRGASRRIEETRRQAEEAERRLEEDRAATVATLRRQQYLDQCPEAREKRVEKRARETKYSNLVQMVEKAAKREAEREVDGLWYGLMLRDTEARRSREIEEEERRATLGKKVAVTLEKQIAGKLAEGDEAKRMKEEEREKVVREREVAEKEESERLERERMKREKLKKDLEEQLLAAKRRLGERAREEATVERMFRELGEAELGRERAAIMESSSRLRREIVAYMRSLEEVRKEEARREAEVEAIVEASVRETETRRDLAKQKAKECRARNIREVLEGREQQLRAKRVAHEEENKRAELEGEMRRKETEVEVALTAEAEARRREDAKRYGQELKAQQKYAETMRLREKEEEEKTLRANLEREQEYQKLTEELLNAPEIITPRAFKILLKECAARREAEQKGLCYHSRSTAPRPLPSLPTTSPDHRS